MMGWHTRAGAAAVVAAVMLGAQPVAGHHSFAVFDTRSEVTVKGTVAEFRWTNPHSRLLLEVAEGGATTVYDIEMGGTGSMALKGWRRTSFKPGDQVTVTINPLRDGSPGGMLVYATDAQGVGRRAR
ncbi:MAG TPA: DUF6152 family protein [Croceibacterium sp.]|nr:DUF6152 family protein [Croceibacterium sp.]